MNMTERTHGKTETHGLVVGRFPVGRDKYMVRVIVHEEKGDLFLITDPVDRTEPIATTIELSPENARRLARLLDEAAAAVDPDPDPDDL
jgi:hypothetical protein